MTVVPAKMIIVEKEPRFRVRRAPAVGPPSSDLRMKTKISNQQSYPPIVGTGKDQGKMSLTLLGPASGTPKRKSPRKSGANAS